MIVSGPVGNLSHPQTIKEVHKPMSKIPNSWACPYQIESGFLFCDLRRRILILHLMKEESLYSSVVRNLTIGRNFTGIEDLKQRLWSETQQQHTYMCLCIYLYT